MKYLVFNSLETSNARNQQIAVNKGCSGNITNGWFNIIKHPEQELYALVIDDETTLTMQEKSELKLYDELNSEGWFVSSLS